MYCFFTRNEKVYSTREQQQLWQQQQKTQMSPLRNQ